MSNSSLVTHTAYSKNNSGKRVYDISRITPHCTAFQATLSRLDRSFLPEENKKSCNYAIDKNGEIGMYVPEDYRSWCSSSESNDQRAVTIECSSDALSPYTMYDIVYTRLKELCVDICRRNGKDTLLWIPDKDKALNYKVKDNELIITVHRWFASKACPGEWLYSRLGELAEYVTATLNKDKANTLYKIQMGAFRNRTNAEAYLDRIHKAGFTDAYIKVENSG